MAAPIAERASRHDVVQWVRTAIGAGHQVLGSASECKRLASRDAVSLAVSVDILEPHRQAAVVTAALLQVECSIACMHGCSVRGHQESSG